MVAGEGCRELPDGDSEVEARRRIEEQFAWLASGAASPEAAPYQISPKARSLAQDRTPQYESLEDGAFANALKFLQKQRQRHREMAVACEKPEQNTGLGLRKVNEGKDPGTEAQESRRRGEVEARQKLNDTNSNAAQEDNVLRQEPQDKDVRPRQECSQSKSDFDCGIIQQDISGAVVCMVTENIVNLEWLQKVEAEKARHKRASLLAQPLGSHIGSSRDSRLNADCSCNDTDREHGRETKKERDVSEVRLSGEGFLYSPGEANGAEQDTRHQAEQEQVLQELREVRDRERAREVKHQAVLLQLKQALERTQELEAPAGASPQGASSCQSPQLVVGDADQAHCQAEAGAGEQEAVAPEGEAATRLLSMRNAVTLPTALGTPDEDVERGGGGRADRGSGGDVHGRGSGSSAHGQPDLAARVTDLSIQLRKAELEKVELISQLLVERTQRKPLEHELERLAGLRWGESGGRADAMLQLLRFLQRRRDVQQLGCAFSALVGCVRKVQERSRLKLMLVERYCFYRRKGCLRAWAHVCQMTRVVREREAASKADDDRDTLRQLRDYMSSRLNVLTARLLRKMFQNVLRGCWSHFQSAVLLRSIKRQNIDKRLSRFQLLVGRRHIKEWRKYACEGRLVHSRLQYDHAVMDAGNERKALIVERDALQRERRALADEKKALASSALEHLEWIESEYTTYIHQVQVDRLAWQSKHWQHHTARLQVHAKMVVFESLAKHMGFQKAASRKLCRRFLTRSFQRWHLNHRLFRLLAGKLLDLEAAGFSPRCTSPSPHRWTALLDSPTASPQRYLQPQFIQGQHRAAGVKGEEIEEGGVEESAAQGPSDDGQDTSSGAHTAFDQALTALPHLLRNGFSERQCAAVFCKICANQPCAPGSRDNSLDGAEVAEADTLLFKPTFWEQSGGVLEGTHGADGNGWVWQESNGDGDGEPEQLLRMEALPLSGLDKSLDECPILGTIALAGDLSSLGLVVQERRIEEGESLEEKGNGKAEEDEDGGRMTIGMLTWSPSSSDTLNPLSTDSSPTSLNSPVCLISHSSPTSPPRMAAIEKHHATVQNI